MTYLCKRAYSRAEMVYRSALRRMGSEDGELFAVVAPAALEGEAAIVTILQIQLSGRYEKVLQSKNAVIC